MKYKLLNRITDQTFKVIDIPEKAYFLGLLWADGHVDGDGISLEILESDGLTLLTCLSKIGDFLTNTRMRNNSDNKQINIRAHSRKLGKYLLENFDYRDKSIASPIKILNHIPENLHRYFWRGYFDGDGSFSKTKTKRPNYFYYRITIYSTYEQDWSEFSSLAKKVNFKFSIEQKIRPKGHKYSLINIGCKEYVKRFANYIYSNEYDGIGLLRKFEVFQDFMKNCEYINK